MTTARDDAGPAQHHLDEATCTTQTATYENAQSADNGTTVPVIPAPEMDAPDWPPSRDWSGERAVIVDALALAVAVAAGNPDAPEFGTPTWADASPTARLMAVLVYLLAVHDRCARAEWAWTDRARQEEESRLTAQREASHAISAAVDWTAVSRRPSHAELERLRAEVVMPQ